MSEKIDRDRRRLLGNAAMVIAPVPPGISSLQSDKRESAIKWEARAGFEYVNSKDDPRNNSS